MEIDLKDILKDMRVYEPTGDLRRDAPCYQRKFDLEKMTDKLESV